MVLLCCRPSSQIPPWRPSKLEWIFITIPKVIGVPTATSCFQTAIPISRKHWLPPFCAVNLAISLSEIYREVIGILLPNDIRWIHTSWWTFCSPPGFDVPHPPWRPSKLEWRAGAFAPHPNVATCTPRSFAPGGGGLSASARMLRAGPVRGTRVGVDLRTGRVGWPHPS